MRSGLTLFGVVLAVLATGPAMSQVSKDDLACLMDKSKCQKTPRADRPKAPVPPPPPGPQPPEPDPPGPQSSEGPKRSITTDLAALYLLTVGEDGKATPSLSLATAVFQLALARPSTGSLTKSERDFLRNMALWAKGSPDLAKAFASFGPTGFGLLAQVFRNADPAASGSLPAAVDAPTLGDRVPSWPVLCSGVNSGNAAITASFQTDNQRLGWMLATRAACEARAALLASAVQDPAAAGIFGAEAEANCKASATALPPIGAQSTASAPEAWLDQVRRSALSTGQTKSDAETRRAAQTCVVLGLSSDNADLAFAGLATLSAFDATYYDLLLATQLRWGLGVEAGAGQAETWLQKAAGPAKQPQTMPGIVQDWTLAAWQAVQE